MSFKKKKGGTKGTRTGRYYLFRVPVILCQDLSVAGKRAGLNGSRSGLYYEAIRIIDELDPTFVLWENVPGLLSSDDGRDLARVFRELDRLGYHGAWTSLDAQYFGLAQRRLRVFGLFARGDTGTERIAEVLSLSEGMQWHPAPSRKAGEGFAADVAPSLNASGRGVERAGESRGQDPVIAMIFENHDQDSRIKNCGDLSPTINKQAGTGGNNLPLICGAFMAGQGVKAGSIGYAENLSPTIKHSESGTNQTPTIHNGMAVRRLTPRECERLQGFQFRCSPDYPGAWRDKLGRWWSPDWTDRDADGKPISDSARYRMLGNAIAVPVVKWIGKRLKEICR